MRAVVLVLIAIGGARVNWQVQRIQSMAAGKEVGKVKPKGGLLPVPSSMGLRFRSIMKPLVSEITWIPGPRSASGAPKGRQ